jgi:molybdopterin-guanine dinucleotide biosynthesis protein A
MSATPVFDALIMAGGAAVRLGGADKPAVRVGGRSLLEHVLDAVRGARRIVVVGPPRPEVARFTARSGAEVRQCQEQPPGGGPVAAIAAGLPDTGADVVLVLAADMPWIAGAVPALVSALVADQRADVAVLTDARGRRNHVAAAWRRPALAAVIAPLGSAAGEAARTLYRGGIVVEVRVGALLPDHAGEDCDTWPDVARARTRAEEDPP